MKVVFVLLVCVLGLPVLAGACIVFLTPAESERPNPVAILETTDSGPTSGRPQPNLIAEVQEYDFGVMPLETDGQHVFHVRNEGLAPLHLYTRPSRFRLNLALSQQVVEPGQTCQVSASWLTGSKAELFNGTALIFSNDPINSRIQFRVQGKVENEFALDPPQLVPPDIRPHQQTVVETLAFSHVWERFEIANLTCTNPRLNCESRPATPESLADHQARSGFVIRVVFPAGLNHGPFREQVTFEAKPADGKQPSKNISIPLQGRVLRRLALYGDKIEFTGIVNLGVVRLGESGSVRLLMKVRDEQLDLPITKIVTQPEFLTANVTPLESTDRDSQGMYHLTIGVPETAPACNYTNTNGRGLGKIRIKFDHPRIKDLDLQVYFTIERKLR